MIARAGTQRSSGDEQAQHQAGQDVDRSLHDLLTLTPLDGRLVPQLKSFFYVEPSTTPLTFTSVSERPSPTPAQDQRFREAVWPHRAALLRVARALTPQSADADDLLQDAMIRALCAIDQFTYGQDARAWLMTILRRTHIDRHRSATRRGLGQHVDVATTEIAEEPTEEPASHIEDPDVWLASFDDETLVAAVRELPDGARWAILLVDIEGLSIVEAAGILEVPEGTVKSRVSRARNTLRQRLQESRHG